MLSFGRYLLGFAATAGVLASIGVASRRLRRGALPSWSGPPAWLADVTISLTILVTVAELLGAMHELRAVPVLIGELVVAGTVWLIAHRVRVGDAEPTDVAAPRVPRGELAAAAAG